MLSDVQRNDVQIREAQTTADRFAVGPGLRSSCLVRIGRHAGPARGIQSSRFGSSWDVKRWC